MSSISTVSAVTKAANDILDSGYAVVRLSELDAGNLHGAIDTAVEFFQRPLEDKNAHGSTDHNYGYRPFGIEYSKSPDRPDMNECFTVWSSRLDLIPNAQDVPELTDSFLAWRDSLAPLVKAILDEVAKNFGVGDAPRVREGLVPADQLLPADSGRARPAAGQARGRPHGHRAARDRTGPRDLRRATRSSRCSPRATRS